jgi:hypothetical protein
MYGEVNQKGHKPMAKESAIFADQNPESKIPGSESYWELIKGYEKLSLKGKDRWIYIFNKLSTIHSQRDPPKNKRKIAGTNETAVGSCKQDATIHDRMIYENQACSLSVSDTDEGLNFT